MALEYFWKDVRYGLRGLRRNPGFGIMVVLTLSLGIGASSWQFNMLRQWVLEGIALPHPEQLQVVWAMDTKQGWTRPASSADFIDWRQQAQVFQNLSAWSGQRFNLTGVDNPETIAGARVSWNFFRTLGVSPSPGRDFREDEERLGASRVAIISFGFWHDHFNSEANTIGRDIELDGVPYVIVGVTPERFQFIFMGHSSVYVPLAFTDKERTDRVTAWLNVIGRERQGIMQSAADQAMSSLAAELANKYPDSNTNSGILLSSLPKEIGKHASAQAIYTGFIVGVCILLICCLNICGLFLGRALARRNEISIRLALGTSRRRLMQQLVTENMAFLPAGIGLGLALAALGGNWITAMIPYETRGLLPNEGTLYIDAQTVFYAMLMGLLSVMIFSLAPIMESRKVNVLDVLKDSNYTSSITKATGRLRQYLLVCEIALALAILVPTGLASTSLANRFKEYPGFNPDHILTGQINLPAVSYGDNPRIIAFTNRLLGEVSTLPGVQWAGVSQSIPFGRSVTETQFEIEGRAQPAPGQIPTAQITSVTGGFDRVFGLHLISGRFIADSDNSDSTAVAVISATLASHQFPAEIPIGHRLRIGRDPRPRMIVGIVDDVKMFRLSDPPANQLYVPFSQAPSNSTWLAIRTTLDPHSLAAFMRTAVQSIDKNQPVSLPMTMEERMNEQESTSRIFAQFCIAFGILALFLAAVGSYGIMSFLMESRKRDMAVRVACGATRPRLLWTVFSSSFKLIVMGLPIGLLAAWGIAHVMSRLLFGVSANDPSIYGRASISLVVAVLLACLVPLMRAIFANPARSLRSE